MEAAEPTLSPEPDEATHAAPIFAIEAVPTSADGPIFINSLILITASFPIIPEGIPVLGGDGAINVPFGDFLGLEI